jgi:hypothetical protein
MKNRAFGDIYNIHDKAVIKISIIADREPKTAENAAVDLTLIAILINFNNNGFLNIIIAGS